MFKDKNWGQVSSPGNRNEGSGSAADAPSREICRRCILRTAPASGQRDTHCLFNAAAKIRKKRIRRLSMMRCSFQFPSSLYGQMNPSYSDMARHSTIRNNGTVACPERTCSITGRGLRTISCGYIRERMKVIAPLLLLVCRISMYLFAAALGRRRALLWQVVKSYRVGAGTLGASQAHGLLARKVRCR